MSPRHEQRIYNREMVNYYPSSAVNQIQDHTSSDERGHESNHYSTVTEFGFNPSDPLRNKSTPKAILEAESRSMTFAHVEELDLSLQNYSLPNVAKRLWRQIQLSGDRQDEFMSGYHFDVGINHSNEEMVMSPNTEQAVFWYKRAADKGHIIAQLNLGVLYETGHQGSRSRDFEAAVTWYHRAALNGHQGAQFNLGRLFWSGKGVPQNLQVAFGYFKKAAKKGNHMAMTNIGAMYMSGNGVQSNPLEARRWSQLAAMKSNAVAHHNLGVMYENGIGGRPNTTLAAIHYRHAMDSSMSHPVSEALSRDLRRSRDPLIFT